MAAPTTFIKLDRNILRWGWYKNPNTFRVFLHLLLTANISDKSFEGITVERGQTVTSYEKISDALDLSVQQVRTAISHLKSTGEITAVQHPKFQLITVVNYNEYQGTPTFSQTDNYQTIANPPTGYQQPFNTQSTFNQQESNNYNNYNKYNNKNNNYNNSQDSSFDADEFFRIAVAHGVSGK